MTGSTEDSDFLVGCIAISEYLGITPRRAWFLCINGRVPSTKLSGKWMARKSSLSKFFDKLEDEHANEFINTQYIMDTEGRIAIIRPKGKMLDLMHLVDDFGVEPESLHIELVTLNSIRGTDQWLTACPVKCEWTDRFGTEKFVVPAAMNTDLGSVPGVFEGIVHRAGPGKDAFFFHDALYQCRPVLANGQRITRPHADYLLYQACTELCGIPHVEAVVVFDAVRIGGSRIWHAHDVEFEPQAVVSNYTPEMVSKAAAEGKLLIEKEAIDLLRKNPYLA